MMIDFHHPPGWPTSQADDEGPGAPDHAAAKPAAKPLRGGALVPDISPSDARGGGLPERSPESPASRNRVASDSEHPVLRLARAC